MKWQVASNSNVISPVERMSSGILTSFIPFQLSDLRSLVTSPVQCFPHITVSLMAPVSDFFSLLNYMPFSCSYLILKGMSFFSDPGLSRCPCTKSICSFVFRISFLRSKGILLLSSNMRIKIFIKYLHNIFT